MRRVKGAMDHESIHQLPASVFITLYDALPLETAKLFMKWSKTTV